VGYITKALHPLLLNLVKNLGNEEEVFHSGVIVEGGGEYLIVKFSVP